MLSPTERAVDMEIEISVPPERVWRAWTESEEFCQWWGEDGAYRVTQWVGDVRPGGKWRSDGVMNDGSSFFVEGEYVTVERPSALSFTWRPAWDDGMETLVSLEFRRTAAGTLLKIHHSGFPTDEACNNHFQGWTRVTGWLRRHLNKEPLS